VRKTDPPYISLTSLTVVNRWYEVPEENDEGQRYASFLLLGGINPSRPTIISIETPLAEKDWQNHKGIFLEYYYS